MAASLQDEETSESIRGFAVNLKRACACACAYVYACVRVSACLSVCLSVSVRTYVCLYVRTYVCMKISLSLFLSHSLCLCLSLSTPPPPPPSLCACECARACNRRQMFSKLRCLPYKGFKFNLPDSLSSFQRKESCCLWQTTCWIIQ